MVWNTFDLFGAGTETTATTLDWAVMYMCMYPDIQEKVHSEIIDVIGRHSLLSYADREKLPFTEACIIEVQRMCSVFPLGLTHRTLCDVEIGGYTLPEDTLVWANLWSIHYNEADFPDPHKFDPSRYIESDSSGESKVRKHRKLVPFSIGE